MSKILTQKELELALEEVLMDIEQERGKQVVYHW